MLANEMIGTLCYPQYKVQNSPSFWCGFAVRMAPLWIFESPKFRALLPCLRKPSKGIERGILTIEVVSEPNTITAWGEESSKLRSESCDITDYYLVWDFHDSVTGPLVESLLTISSRGEN